MKTAAPRSKPLSGTCWRRRHAARHFCLCPKRGTDMAEQLPQGRAPTSWRRDPVRASAPEPPHACAPRAKKRCNLACANEGRRPWPVRHRRLFTTDTLRPFATHEERTQKRKGQRMSCPNAPAAHVRLWQQCLHFANRWRLKFAPPSLSPREECNRVCLMRHATKQYGDLYATRCLSLADGRQHSQPQNPLEGGWRITRPNASRERESHGADYPLVGRGRAELLISGSMCTMGLRAKACMARPRL